MIYLNMATNTDQFCAQGINLLFFLPCGAVALIIHTLSRRVDWRSAWLCILSGVPGTLIGSWVAGQISVSALGRIFSLLLIGMGLFTLFSKKKADGDNGKAR